MKMLRFFLISLITISFCVLCISFNANAGDKGEIRTLFGELMRFKDDAKFHQVGFGECCKYYEWKKKVKLLRNDHNLSTIEKIAAGDLEMLGLEYMKTKGRDNDYTQFAKQAIKDAIE